MSKIQNLKAIHNSMENLIEVIVVVSDVKDTKFESNSQLQKLYHIFSFVVSDVKDTKFESNSQPIVLSTKKDVSCF